MGYTAVGNWWQFAFTLEICCYLGYLEPSAVKDNRRVQLVRSIPLHELILERT